MKKVLLSSLVALMAITTANAAGVSGIASTDYVDNVVGNIEIPDLKGDEETIVVENETIKAITETEEIGTNATSLVTSGAVKTALDTKADKATTLSDYGITDAYTQTETDNLLKGKYDANKITVADGAVTIDGTQIATKADILTLPTTGALDDKISKTEDVDSNLSDATDSLVPSTTAVKTELDKKADKDTTYTKTETDNLLGAKADKSDIVIKTHASGNEDTISVTDVNNTVTVTANVDTTPTADSAKLITSGAVKTALDTKADQTAVDALATDAVRVDKDSKMIFVNNTDYGDCAEGDTCTLVAVRTASGMQSVWKKIFPAAQ